jgi:hypothetical protein
MQKMNGPGTSVPQRAMQRIAPRESFELLTTKEAAQVLGLSPAMLERLRWMGEGPPFIRPTGYGRAVRYLWQDLVDWIERNRVDASR